MMTGAMTVNIGKDMYCHILSFLWQVKVSLCLFLAVHWLKLPVAV
jgi:hypothetical protein